MAEKNLINLCNTKQGQKVRIAKINAGIKATKRLADMGLIINTDIDIIRKTPFCGPIEIKVRGSNLILGKQISNKILVKNYE